MLVYFALPPFDVWWLAWIGLVPLLAALPGCTPKEAFFFGWLAGATTNFWAFHWLKGLMDQFSNLGPAAYLVMVIMALYQGIPFALWSLYLRKGRRPSPSLGRIAVVCLTCALSLPVIEYFYPIVFPWYMANTQHTVPWLLGPIELGGCGLLSTAVVVVNLCLARCILPAKVKEEPRVWPLPVGGKQKGALFALAVATFASCLLFSQWRLGVVKSAIEQAEKLEIGLVQPNQWIKQGNAYENLHQYQYLTYQLVKKAEAQGQPLDLVLWPESAVRTPATRHFSERGPGPEDKMVRYPRDLTRVVQGTTVPQESLTAERVDRWEMLAVQRGHDVPILFGTTVRDWDPAVEGPMPGRPPLLNCGVLVGKEGEVLGLAPKVKLLLFGETIPMSGYFPQVYKLLPLASALLPGTEPIVIEYDKKRLGMMICYEDLLPWFHYELGSARPQVLLNLTNDAWFGKTAEAEAHLALSKLRAIEGRVFLVRSTSTGVSAFVSATGDVTGQIGQDVQGTLHQQVPLLDIDTGFERFGDSAVWLGLIVWIPYLLSGLFAKRFGG